MTRTWTVRCDEPGCDNVVVEGMVATGWVEFDGLHHCQEHATVEDMVMVIIESWRDPRKQAEQVLVYLREQMERLHPFYTDPSMVERTAGWLDRRDVMRVLGGTDE